MNQSALPNNTRSNEYLSVPTLAAMSDGTEFAWRKRIFKRQIPFVKFGRNVRVHRDDFAAWVAARRIAADQGRAERGPGPQGVAAQPEGQQ